MFSYFHTFIWWALVILGLISLISSLLFCNTLAPNIPLPTHVFFLCDQMNLTRVSWLNVSGELLEQRQLNNDYSTGENDIHSLQQPWAAAKSPSMPGRPSWAVLHPCLHDDGPPPHQVSITWREPELQWVPEYSGYAVSRCCIFYTYPYPLALYPFQTIFIDVPWALRA